MDESVVVTVTLPNVCQCPENEAGKTASALRAAGAEYKATTARAATVKPPPLFNRENICMKRELRHRWRGPPFLDVLAEPISATEAVSACSVSRASRHTGCDDQASQP